MVKKSLKSRKGKKEKIFTKQFVIGFILGSVIVPIILQLIFFPLYEYYIIGSKLRTYVYDDLDYTGESPAFILDVENKGGVTLHNLSANIQYVCQRDGLNITGKRSTGPRILPKGEVMEFSFPNKDLISEIEQSKMNCSDVVLSLYHMKKIDNNNFKIIEGYAIGFELVWSDTSTLKTHIVSVTDLKDKTQFVMCKPCKINYFVKSDEISDSGTKEVKVGAITLDSLKKINETLMLNIDSTDKWIIIPLTFYVDCKSIYCADLPYQLLKKLYPNITSNAITLTADTEALIKPGSCKILCISSPENKLFWSDDPSCKKNGF
jgi:hypothetical protein